MITSIRKRKLEIIVFVSGAVVMILELVGSRVVAPYVGTSIYIWTNLIGVILGSLSLGYYIGGKLADRGANYAILALILFCASITVLLLSFLQAPILSLVARFPLGVQWQSLIAVLILFTPASLLLGMVSPYAARMKIENLETSGRTLGNLYALGTAGSIFGTFLAGFYLIAALGTSRILLVLSFVLVLLSFLAYRGTNPKVKVVLSMIIILSIFGTHFEEKRALAEGLVDLDSQYYRIMIKDSDNASSTNRIRLMLVGGEAHSGIFLEGDELLFPYTRFFRLSEHFTPDAKNALMIGAGGYSYPKNFLKQFPEARLHVAEIDPKMTELAQKYFNLKLDPRLIIHHEDGRSFINKTPEKFDAIFIDAFSSYYSIPYELTTKEAIRKMYDQMNEEGAVIVNIIGSLTGDKGKFLRAEYRTFAEVFPQVYIFPVEYSAATEELQNIMLVALKSEYEPSFENPDPEIDSYLRQQWVGVLAKDMPVLTDDFAPVDQYVKELVRPPLILP